MQQKIKKYIRISIGTILFLSLMYIIVSLRIRLVESRLLITTMYYDVNIGEMLIEKGDYENAVRFSKEVQRNILQYAVRCNIRHSMLPYAIDSSNNRGNVKHKLQLSEADYNDLKNYLSYSESFSERYLRGIDNALCNRYTMLHKNWDSICLTDDIVYPKTNSFSFLYCNIYLSSNPSNDYNYSMDLMNESHSEYGWLDFTNQVARSDVFSSNVVYNVLLHCPDDINIDAITPLADLLLNTYNQRSVVLCNKYRFFKLPDWKIKQYEKYYDE